MVKYAMWLRWMDRLCARLNAGLTAVALALSLVLAVQLTVRASTLLDSAQQQLITLDGDPVALSSTAN